MWNLITALPVLKTIQDTVQPLGAHSGLCGSVLFKGESEKDLDVIIYPHDKEKGYDIDAITVALTAAFGAAPRECKSSASCIRDGKQVRWLKTSAGKRIDFFFLS